MENVVNSLTDSMSIENFSRCRELMEFPSLQVMWSNVLKSHIYGKEKNKWENVGNFILFSNGGSLLNGSIGIIFWTGANHLLMTSIHNDQNINGSLTKVDVVKLIVIE